MQNGVFPGKIQQPCTFRYKEMAALVQYAVLVCDNGYHSCDFRVHDSLMEHSPQTATARQSR